LQIHLGDTLTFTVGSEQFTAQVANIRSVEWETMKPNFYMIFSAHTIEKYPSTFLTSFYLPENQKEVLNSLLKTYPSTTILEVDAILQQFKTILNQLTQAINYLLYFALIAGLTVLFAAVYATLDYRIYEGALMRSLGASRLFLRKTHLIEFCFLGLMSGVLAVVMSETILYFLYTRVMHIHYQPNFILWFLVPLLGLLLVGLTGFWGVRKVVNQPPMKILREQ
jgi:putative ABC transport system permease protein